MSASSRQTSRTAKPKPRLPSSAKRKSAGLESRKTGAHKQALPTGEAVAFAQDSVSSAVNLLRERIDVLTVSEGVRPLVSGFMAFLDEAISELDEMVSETTQMIGDPHHISLTRIVLQIVEAEKGYGPSMFKRFHVEISDETLKDWKLVSALDKAAIYKSMTCAQRRYTHRPNQPIHHRSPARLQELAGSKEMDQKALAEKLHLHNEAKTDEERNLLRLWRSRDLNEIRNLYNRTKKAAFDYIPREELKSEMSRHDAKSEMYEVIRDNWIHEDLRFGLCWFTPDALAEFLVDWGLPRIQNPALRKFIERNELLTLNKPIVDFTDYKKGKVKIHAIADRFE